MWGGSEISIDKSKPKRYVSVLACRTAGSVKSFKALGLDSAYSEGKTSKLGRNRQVRNGAVGRKQKYWINPEAFQNYYFQWGGVSWEHEEKKGLQSPIFGGADHHCAISQSCLLAELPQYFTHSFMPHAGPQSSQGCWGTATPSSSFCSRQDKWLRHHQTLSASQTPPFSLRKQDVMNERDHQTK